MLVDGCRFVDKAIELEEVAISEQSARREFRRSQPYTGCLQSCYNAKLGLYMCVCLYIIFGLITRYW